MESQDPFTGVVTAAHVYGAVVEVGQKVVQVDHKVDLVDGKIAQVDAKVDGVVATVSDLQNRVRELEATRWPRSNLTLLLAALAVIVSIVALWRGW